ncbi:polysaccharide deacetylase family protein [Streptomyces phyllanthi]|uniref:Polysaccharide deacetylase family protein n=1 Tax=Streptomyces phyllanthi TaxID=1803180 RepID=A0A5N8W5Y5_9ACTN|nr:polysaccharide deacetylase family protein [Streptomyces phyllanthi]MPY42893.1 polysaccharide deacetylase family protein [Streptomyces phyllanthi]
MAKLTLTFDNGPTPGVTEQVLDTLAARGLKATFFVIGQKLASDTGRELAERTRAEGHWLGNHTMTHGEPLGLLRDPRREAAEITEAQAALGELAEPARYFRPTGHGSVGPHLLSPTAADVLTSGGYTMVLWSLFVRDSKMPEGWADRALRRLPESEWHVLVVHDLPTGAMDELPRFLDTVNSMGIEIVQEFPEACTPMRGGRPRAQLDRLYVTPQEAASVPGDH